MTPEEFREARRTIGESWGLGRPLTTTEMGEILRFRSPRPGDRIFDIERGHDSVTGPIQLAVEAMLDGYIPRHVHPWGSTVIIEDREAA